MRKLFFLVLSLGSILFASAISDLAATMKAGEWKELTGTTGWNRDLIIKDVNGEDGSTGATDWSDQLAWDPSTRQIRFLGLGHYRAWKCFAYYDTADTWAEIKPLPDSCMYVGGACIGHAYHRNTINTDSGIHYFHTGGSILSCDIRTNAWSKVMVPSGYTGSFGNAVEYFPAIKSLMHGFGGGVSVLNLATGTWSRVSGTFSVGPYHNTAAMSVRHKKFFYGGGNNSSSIYMIDSSLSSERLPDVPGMLHVAYSTLTSDPVTGDILYLSDKDTLYALDPERPVWLPLYNSLPPFKGHVLATPVSNYGVVLFAQPGNKVWLYKHALWNDTSATTGLELSSHRTTVEQFLSTPLVSVVTFEGGRTDTITYRTAYLSLDPEIATVSAAGVVTGWKVGAARLAGFKKNVSDTITFTITASTAVVDSVRLSHDTIKFLSGDSFNIHATGYYHKGTEFFSREIDTVAVWSSSSEANATVNRGLVRGVSAMETVNVIAEHMGAFDTCRVTVWPRPAYIKRINFQISATPFKFGWLASNGETYSAARGYGWVSGAGSSRDDRGGSNFLLKSFVIGNPGVFRIDAPDGQYVVKMAMGDNQYGTGTYNWTTSGTDTVCRKPAGISNGICAATFVVSGGYANFTVNGPVNYMVIISDEGIDVNIVADDGTPYTAVNTMVENPAEPDVVEIQTSNPPEPLVFAMPNPFNPVVRLRYGLPVGVKKARMEILNGTGCVVFRTTIHGSHEIVWNARDNNGRAVSAGLYLVRLECDNGRTAFARMLLAR